MEAPRQTAASNGSAAERLRAKLLLPIAWDILVRKRLEISSLLSRRSLMSLVPSEGTKETKGTAWWGFAPECRLHLAILPSIFAPQFAYL